MRVDANLLHPLRQVYIVSRIEPMPGVSLCSNMKTWQADIPWQREWQPSRYIVCNKGGMGKGGKREGDSELKLRRSWDISP